MGPAALPDFAGRMLLNRLLSTGFRCSGSIRPAAFLRTGAASQLGDDAASSGVTNIAARRTPAARLVTV
jgi:hypothetical protein